MPDRPKPKTIRCAIYTRKSSEEGLDQDFNSLQAQREACEAFIASQRHEGWRVLPAVYDDGGYSGGSMERPALGKLLGDIKSGAIDAVVVYKVDRLTRSLADFAKIVEVFDQSGVSFVSITQQFNTTTSMGRLTLNILLSFAQFEREVTGERIRDKFAASKKKGLWMGGFVPLGYRANGRTLVINEAEAKIVRIIFDLYLEYGSVAKVEAELQRRRMTRPQSTTMTTDRLYGGRPFTRGDIYKLLSNPIYVGDIGHKGQCYEGQHPGIIDRRTWTSARAQLAANTRARYIRLDAKDPSLLAGILYDVQNNRLTPTHANKQGRRYRYYVLQPANAGPRPRGRPKASSCRWHIAAAEIETVVTEKLRNVLLNQHWLIDRCVLPDGIIAERKAAISKGQELAECLRSTSAGVLRELLLCLITRVTLGETEVRIDLNRAGLLARLGLAASNLIHGGGDGEPPPGGSGRNSVTTRGTWPASGDVDDFAIVATVALRRRGVETRLMINSPDSQDTLRQPDAALIKVVAQARRWWDDIVAQRFPTIQALARAYDKDERYVARLLPLAFLAPSIVEAILAGLPPVDLTAQELVTLQDLPVEWNAQQSTLGFSPSGSFR